MQRDTNEWERLRHLREVLALFQWVNQKVLPEFQAEMLSLDQKLGALDDGYFDPRKVVNPDGYNTALLSAEATLRRVSFQLERIHTATMSAERNAGTQV